MATFAISFRVADTPGRQDRYDSFIERIVREHDDDDSPWVETTSLILIDSPKTANKLKSDLVTHSEINSYSGDKFVVIDCNNFRAAHYGLENEELFESYF